MANKEEHIYVAHLAEQAERYEEMVDAIKQIAKRGVGLTEEERDLLSVAYKNVIGARRASWRTVSILEIKEKEKEKAKTGDELQRKLTEMYRKEIETELRSICEDILTLLDETLIPSANLSEKQDGGGSSEGNESYIFYYKMKGDYLRYLAEFSMGNDRKSASENSLLAYKAASDKAEALEPIHPIRLGLALNFSIFFYEILNSPERACRLAKQTLDSAIAEVDGLPEGNHKENALRIMQLLRDNLTLWTSDMQEDYGESVTNKQVE